MLIFGFLGFDFTNWTTWVVLVVGVVVAVLVIAFGIFYGRWRRRRRLAWASREEDLPWDQLLDLLRKRKSVRAPAGLPLDREAGLAPDDDLPPDELLKQLLSGLSSMSRGSSQALPEELKFLESGGVEKRASRRRWGNPTEVYLSSLVWPGRLHGLVINRSTGGLAIFVDQEVAAGSSLKVRSAEAPHYVAAAEVEVRYCRPVGKSFLIGCRFCDEIPWNVRVWFG
jgi:hypothetical protein